MLLLLLLLLLLLFLYLKSTFHEPIAGMISVFVFYEVEKIR